MLDERLYLMKVEKTMAKVHARFLGQSLPLETILPKHLSGVDKKKKAEQIAAQYGYEQGTPRTDERTGSGHRMDAEGKQPLF